MTCAAFGITRIVYGFSADFLTRLNPSRNPTPDYASALRDMGFSIELVGPCLEDEAAKTMEWWRGEYHPIEQLLKTHIVGNPLYQRKIAELHEGQ